MTTTIVYYPHAIYLTGGVVITQLSDVQPSHNFMDITEFSPSQAVPQFTGSHQASPDNRFSTSQVKAILDFCTDYGIARDISGLGNVDVEYKAGINNGVRTPDASLAHIRARGTANTLVCWESFTARQGQIVELRCRLVHVYNVASGVDPLVFTNAVALTNVSAINYLFSLGLTKINGTGLTGVEEVTWNNNIEYEEVASDGDPFLSYCGIKRFRPTISINSLDLSLISTFGTRGTALSALSVFLRKRLASGINVADATAQHIGLTATVGTVKARQVNSGGRTVANVTIDLAASAQNTSPFTLNSATAIS